MASENVERVSRATSKAVNDVGLVPAWISFVVFWLFVKGCIGGGCSMQSGATEVLRTGRQAWHDSAPQTESESK